ncbi:hypothetical protein EYF80_028472 [Liparis tanakae]|uniref:Uncharacterized protein n=1 Tax=Liparis tanakae TaxID=230148 RepID=A0A4Z2H638_9TELE|nr:hypothetical protein EYF80_028472 [Liparis tanakae]
MRQLALYTEVPGDTRRVLENQCAEQLGISSQQMLPEVEVWEGFQSGPVLSLHAPCDSYPTIRRHDAPSAVLHTKEFESRLLGGETLHLGNGEKAGCSSCGVVSAEEGKTASVSLPETHDSLMRQLKSMWSESSSSRDEPMSTSGLRQRGSQQGARGIRLCRKGHKPPWLVSIILNYLSSGLQMRLSVETESVGRITGHPPSRFPAEMCYIKWPVASWELLDRTAAVASTAHPPPRDICMRRLHRDTSEKVEGGDVWMGGERSNVKERRPASSRLDGKQPDFTHEGQVQCVPPDFSREGEGHLTGGRWGILASKKRANNVAGSRRCFDLFFLLVVLEPKEEQGGWVEEDLPAESNGRHGGARGLWTLTGLGSRHKKLPEAAPFFNNYFGERVHRSVLKAAFAAPLPAFQPNKQHHVGTVQPINLPPPPKGPTMPCYQHVEQVHHGMPPCVFRAGWMRMSVFQFKS